MLLVSYPIISYEYRSLKVSRQQQVDALKHINDENLKELTSLIFDIFNNNWWRQQVKCGIYSFSMSTTSGPNIPFKNKIIEPWYLSVNGQNVYKGPHMDFFNKALSQAKEKYIKLDNF